MLAAGLGRRLRPLTATIPKPVIPVLGRPIAVEILHRLAMHGVDDVVVNLHHLPEQVERIVGLGNETGLPVVHYSYEPRILGTAGGLAQAAPWLLGHGPVLVHNCDFLSDIDLDGAVQAHLESGFAATLVLAPPREGYPVVDVDESGRVLSIAGRPEPDPGRVRGSYLFTGCHVIDEEVLERIPRGRPSDIVTEVYRPLVAEGRLGGWLHRGFWWEFGDPVRYLEGTLRLIDLPLARRLEITTHDGVRETHGGRAAIGPGAMLREGVRVEGRAAIGMACLIGRDAVLHDSVIMPEAWIGPGCRLERTIVGPGVEVPGGFRARDMMICEARSVVDDDPVPGARREGCVVVCPLAGERRSSS